MKKIINFLTASAGMLFLFAGCSSTPFMVQDMGSVAIISISSNMNVPYELDQVRDDEYGTEEGMVSNAVNGFFGKNNPEILCGPDRLTYADESLRRLLSENAGVQVIDKETVLNSDTYSAIGEGILGYTDVKIRGDGYKSLDYLATKKTRMLCKEIGATNTMFVNFTFKKKLVHGNKISGDVAATAKMEISVFNSEGKDILWDEFYTTSLKTVEVSKWDYDKDELTEMFPELIDILINQFIVKYM